MLVRGTLWIQCLPSCNGHSVSKWSGNWRAMSILLQSGHSTSRPSHSYLTCKVSELSLTSSSIIGRTDPSYLCSSSNFQLMRLWQTVHSSTRMMHSFPTKQPEHAKNQALACLSLLLCFFNLLCSTFSSQGMKCKTTPAESALQLWQLWLLVTLPVHSCLNHKEPTCLACWTYFHARLLQGT